MGLPVKNLILASNENDILSRFFNTGEYRTGDVCFTHSPSMDIQVASNFERYLYYLVGQDSAKVTSLMNEFSVTGLICIDKECMDAAGNLFKAGSGTNEKTLETIKNFYEGTGYLLDPHTAVGVYVARQFDDGETPMICLSTAHPAKFPEAIIEATSKDIAKHDEIEKIMDFPIDYTVVANDTMVVKNFVKKHL
jgi:threonine synthase